MNSTVLNVYRVIKDASITITHKIIKFIPKDDRLLLFNAWFGQKYSDNTMYLYEYLLKDKKYHVAWTTSNKEIYNKLKREKKPVVMSNSLKGMWTQIRAKVLFSTIQLNDYNAWLLANCFYIDLDHGIIFKQVGYDIYSDSSTYMMKHDAIVKSDIHYYMTTPSYLTSLMMKHSYHVDQDHILLLGKARLDYFYDESLRRNDTTIKKIKGDKKAIVYMPTHRKCGDIPLHINKILDLNFIDKLCEENGYIFLIKKHFYHRNEYENLEHYNNIIDVTHMNIDAQEMLFNADILVTDYSSCYIDYLILDRPLVLYTFDLEDYLKTERGLFINIQDLDIGYKTKEKDELNNILQDVIKDSSDRYKDKRDKVKRIYFDEKLPVGHYREQIMNTVDSLLDATYQPSWDQAKMRTFEIEGFWKLANTITNK